MRSGGVEVERAGGGGKREAATEMGTTVGPRDRVWVQGQPLPEAERARVWVHNKKQHVLVTHQEKDRLGRVTLFPRLREMGLPHLISVGRLDFNSEGLLLLTNNGMLARHLEHPSNSFRRVYRVRAFGLLTDHKVASLAKGMHVKGIKYQPVLVEHDPEKQSSIHEQRQQQQRERQEAGGEDKYRRKNVWLRMTLTEGKSREIRHLLSALNIKTSRIIRVQYGPYHLDSLPPGDVKEVPLHPSLRDALRSLATPNRLCLSSSNPSEPAKALSSSFTSTFKSSSSKASSSAFKSPSKSPSSSKFQPPASSSTSYLDHRPKRSNKKSSSRPGKRGHDDDAFLNSIV